MLEAPPAEEITADHDFGRCIGQCNLSDGQKHALITQRWVPKSKVTTAHSNSNLNNFLAL